MFFPAPIVAECVKRYYTSKWHCRGEKSSSGAGRRLQGDLQYYKDSAHARTNQRSWWVPKNRTVDRWLMN